MAEPQDLKAIRNLLENVSKSIADAGISNKGAMLAPGALVATIKAMQFITQHIESLEDRIKALESKP